MRHHGFSCSSLYTVTPEQAQENLLIELLRKDKAQARIAEQARKRLRALGRVDEGLHQESVPRVPEEPLPQAPVAEKPGSVADPERYRPCSQCGRLAFDLTVEDDHHLVVAS